MEELINVNVGVVVTEADIEDIMLLATEGTSHWADDIQVCGEYLGEDECEHLANGGFVAFHVKDAEDGPEWYELSPEMLAKGICQYLNDSENNPAALLYYNGARTEIDLGEVDRTVADQMVQYALFGKQVFVRRGA